MKLEDRILELEIKMKSHEAGFSELIRAVGSLETSNKLLREQIALFEKDLQWFKRAKLYLVIGASILTFIGAVGWGALELVTKFKSLFHN